MAIRDFGDLSEILQAAVAHLIAQLPTHCKASNTFMALNPDSVEPNAGYMSFVVSPMGGSFPGEFQDGGGVQQVTTETGMLITIHSPLQMDEPRRDTKFLTDNSKGVIGVATKVLKAFTQWDPRNADSILLREPATPTGFNFKRSDRSLGSMELEFRLNFDWGLDA